MKKITSKSAHREKHATTTARPARMARIHRASQSALFFIARHHTGWAFSREDRFTEWSGSALKLRREGIGCGHDRNDHRPDDGRAFGRLSWSAASAFPSISHRWVCKLRLQE